MSKNSFSWKIFYSWLNSLSSSYSNFVLTNFGPFFFSFQVAVSKVLLISNCFTKNEVPRTTSSKKIFGEKKEAKILVAWKEGLLQLVKTWLHHQFQKMF
eukprot:UN02047